MRENETPEPNELVWRSLPKLPGQAVTAVSEAARRAEDARWAAAE